MLKNRKALTTLEYTIVLAIIFLSMVGFMTYFQRSLQGRWKSNSDAFSDEQWAPNEAGTQGTVETSSIHYKENVAEVRDRGPAIVLRGSTLHISQGGSAANHPVYNAGNTIHLPGGRYD